MFWGRPKINLNDDFTNLNEFFGMACKIMLNGKVYRAYIINDCLDFAYRTAKKKHYCVWYNNCK